MSNIIRKYIHLVEALERDRLTLDGVFQGSAMIDYEKLGRSGLIPPGTSMNQAVDDLLKHEDEKIHKDLTHIIEQHGLVVSGYSISDISFESKEVNADNIKPMWAELSEACDEIYQYFDSINKTNQSLGLPKYEVGGIPTVWLKSFGPEEVNMDLGEDYDMFMDYIDGNISLRDLYNSLNQY